MLEHKWLGDKTKGGFTRRPRAETARTLVSQSTGRPSSTIRREKPKFPALDMAKNLEDTVHA